MINCSLDVTPISVYTSNVVFANPLPVVFRLESDVFPTNMVEYTTFTVTGAADSNGYAQITLSLSSTGYACGDYVTLTGTYEGVYQITSLTNGGVFVIDAPYINTGTTPVTGTVQKYYNSYYVEVNVYAGIPLAHNYSADNPMELVTTLRVTPNTSNIAEIDISSAIRAKFLQIENDVCSQVETSNYYLNDRRAWVAFYIEYREVYDYGLACEVEQYTSAWTESEVYYAINGTTQFQYAYGNNAGEYVLNDNNLVLPTKFLTDISTPLIFSGYEMDLAMFIPEALMNSGQTIQLEVVSNVGTYTQTVDFTLGEGVYRFLLGDILESELAGASYFDVSLLINNYTNTETKRVNINTDCSQYGGAMVTYLNTLGGWDYVYFANGQDTQHSTTETQTMDRNIFADWATLWTGSTTQKDVVLRKARKGGVLRTLPLPKNFFREVSKQLASTVKVQQIIELSQDVSCLDVANRLTLIVEKDAFRYSDTDKNYIISLEYTTTNETLSQWQ